MQCVMKPTTKLTGIVASQKAAEAHRKIGSGQVLTQLIRQILD